MADKMSGGFNEKGGGQGSASGRKYDSAKIAKRETDRRKRERNPSPPDLFEEEKARKRSRNTEEDTLKRVKFDKTIYKRNQDEFISKSSSQDVKVRRRNYIDSAKDHRKIFVDTYRKIVKLYKKLGDERCIEIAEIDSKGIVDLKRAMIQAIININEKNKIGDNSWKKEDYNKFMKIVEYAVDVEEKLEQASHNG